MSFKSTVTSDTKQIADVIQRLKRLESYSVEYGYYDEDLHSSGKGMATLAAIHEYGDGAIPERPFLSQADDYLGRWYEVSNRWKQDINNYLKNGGNIVSVLTYEGNRGSDAIQTVINRQDFVENVAWWREWKQAKYGHSDILRASNEMYEGAKVKVIKNA